MFITLRRMAQTCADMKPGPGNYRDRHLLHNLGPSAPFRQFDEIVRAHDPNKMDGRKSRFQYTDDIDGILRAEAALHIADPKIRMVCHALR